MAIHYISASWDSESQSIFVVPSSLDYVEAGDTVEFSGGTWSNFSSSYWDDTSSTTGGTKTVKSTVSTGTSTTVKVTLRDATKNVPIYFDTKDETVSAITLEDITDADPKALMNTHSLKISGINSSITAKISTSSGLAAYIRVGSTLAAPRTSITVYNGYKIYIEAEAPHDYDQSSTVTLTLGSYSYTFTISTREYPIAEQVIELGIDSGTIYFMNDVVNFFGSKSSTPKLTDYLRGNELVPSILENSHVPDTAPIALTDLYGTVSALYFTYKPPNKTAIADTSDSGATIYVAWDIANDYGVGYGELAKELEYKYEVTRLDSKDSIDVDVTTSTSTSYSTWSQSNSYIKLSATSEQSLGENILYGQLTIYARNAVDTSVVISKTVGWTLAFVSA